MTRNGIERKNETDLKSQPLSKGFFNDFFLQKTDHILIQTEENYFYVYPFC